MTDYNFWQMKGYADNRVDAGTRKLVEKVSKLEKKNKELERQLKEKDATIKTLRAEIADKESRERKR
jgi:cell division septum initiation protein DivIVA